MRETFTDRIYAVVARIPRGKVASYGWVAMLAGRPQAARAVGTAMRDVPEKLRLPCHRVIRSDGTLAEKRIFAGRQRAMLQREGVRFRNDGRVDMNRSEWNPTRKLKPPAAVSKIAPGAPYRAAAVRDRRKSSKVEATPGDESIPDSAQDRSRKSAAARAPATAFP